jgi:hypothetical protein
MPDKEKKVRIYVPQSVKDAADKMRAQGSRVEDFLQETFDRLDAEGLLPIPGPGIKLERTQDGVTFYIPCRKTK